MSFDCLLCGRPPLPSDDLVITGCGHVLHQACLRAQPGRACPQCSLPTCDTGLKRIFLVENSDPETDESVLDRLGQEERKKMEEHRVLRAEIAEKEGLLEAVEKIRHLQDVERLRQQLKEQLKAMMKEEMLQTKMLRDIGKTMMVVKTEMDEAEQEWPIRDYMLKQTLGESNIKPEPTGGDPGQELLYSSLELLDSSLEQEGFEDKELFFGFEEEEKQESAFVGGGGTTVVLGHAVASNIYDELDGSQGFDKEKEAGHNYFNMKPVLDEVLPEGFDCEGPGQEGPEMKRKLKDGSKLWAKVGGHHGDSYNKVKLEYHGDWSAQSVQEKAGDKAMLAEQELKLVLQVAQQVARQEVKQEVKPVLQSVVPGERRFGCAECGWRFTQAGARARHVRTVHRGERPFSCNQPGCHRRFGAWQQLRSHLALVHDGPGCRAFACRQAGCTAAFGRSEYLEAHLRTVHGHPKLRCSVFGCREASGFVWLSGLRRHVKKSHLSGRM